MKTKKPMERRIQIRVSNEQYFEILGRALASGLSISSYSRMILLSKDKKEVSLQ